MCRAGTIEKAVQAHGGLERLKSIQAVDVVVERSGLLWLRKGYPGRALVTVTVQVDLPKVTSTNLAGHEEDTFVKSSWTPRRTWKEGPDGTVIESRENARASFEGQKWDSP